ncbi:ABC transporter permease [Kribbella turkmenica]|uniref:ABC transporter permease n=1 Tax=Kribbella turkmenica TaxID=2530375 RepID=A0A4R4X5I3_9ACTN|nr:ABC transporter permease subunit [Kribbella turkmenica]TDD25616.1 ABC transporter permease [Kribbella turkmenica]
MLRLTGVELRRLAARRLTVVGVLGVLVITALLLVVVWNDARPLSAEEQRSAQLQYEAAHAYWVENGEEDRRRCEADWDKQPDPKPAKEELCNFREPTVDDFGKPRVVFAETTPDRLLGASYLLVFAAFLIGASFVGAEFSTGAIGNWLTFEPRRLRVYGSKLLAAALGFVPVAGVVLSILLLGTYLIIGRLGDTSGTTAEVWGDLTAIGGRAVLLVAIGAALGGVVGLLLRHTAAAIGVAMGYLVLIEGVFAGFLNSAQPWLVKLNFDAFVRHDTTYYVNECGGGDGGNYVCNSIEKTLSFEHGAWYLGIVAVVLVLLGGAVFHRRDVNS